MNLVTNPLRVAAVRPDHPAILSEGQTWSYGTLARDCLCLGQGLRALGTTPGDKVALLMPNVPAFVVAYHGILAAGAIVASLSAAAHRDDVAWMLRDTGAGVLLVHTDLLHLVPGPEETPHLQHVFAAGESGPLPSRVLDWSALFTHGTGAPTPRTNQDPAALLYTSGTTGRAKGALLSHGNVGSNVAAVALCTGTRPSDHLLCFVPLSHCFGQNHVMGGALRAGATLVLHRRFDLDRVEDSPAQEGVTHLYGVPTVFRRLLDRPSGALGALRYCFSAAAPLDVHTETAWASRFPTVLHQGYGLTESSPMACYNHPLGHVPGTVGAAIDGVDVVIAGEDGSLLPVCQPGEVLIRGPNVMLGYHRQPEETARVIQGGWLRTGDVGWLDDRGNLSLVGRLKELINVAGWKVWPREVEEVLTGLPGVAHAAVLGLPDADLGERVVAAIVPGHPAPSAEALLAGVRARLAHHKVPAEVYFLDTIPTSPSGKVLTATLRETILGRINGSRTA